MDSVDKVEKHPDPAKQKLSTRHECLFCFRVFESSYRLRRHSIIHSTEKNIFHCQFCELSFRLHKELLMHEATHKRTLANINLKRCQICGIACYNDNLLAHLKEHHEHFECDICQKVYRTKNYLKLHMTIHINAREYKCSICPKSFNFISQLKRHETSHSTTCVWYCEICGVGFKNKPNLTHHMRSHNGEKPFQCDRCDRCFSAKQSLHLHIRIHDGEKPYKCPWVECGRGFYDMTTMKVHTRLHTNENPYKCHLCGKTTKQASNLKSHYLHAHKIKDITSKTIRANARLFEKYKTENLPEAGLLELLSQQGIQNIEKQRTDGNASTIKHEATSDKFSNVQLDADERFVNNEQSTNVIADRLAPVNNVNCIESLTAIKTENSFDFDAFPQSVAADDIRDKLLIKQEVCANVPATPSENTKAKKEIRKSSRTNRTEPKQDIEKVFIDEQQSTELAIRDEEFVTEEDRVHEFLITELEKSCREALQMSKCTDSTDSKLPARTPTETSSQKREPNNKFECDICPRSFRHKTKLKVHMKSHRNDAITSAATRATDKVKMCEICGKTYTQNSALQKHLKFAHSNFRPFPCEICGRAFKDSNGLKVHLRSHSGEKPYNCSFCPKSFSTSMGRNLHQRGHTGEKPYKCTFCDSAFSDNSTCRQHIRVHTGEKPYVCHLCGKGTTQAGNLKSHLRHAHKIQLKNVTMKRNI